MDETAHLRARVGDLLSLNEHHRKLALYHKSHEHEMLEDFRILLEHMTCYCGAPSCIYDTMVRKYRGV